MYAQRTIVITAIASGSDRMSIGIHRFTLVKTSLAFCCPLSITKK
jgi:hypothetical protein